MNLVNSKAVLKRFNQLIDTTDMTEETETTDQEEQEYDYDLVRNLEDRWRRDTERYRFHVFRNGDGEVQSWALMVHKQVEGEPSIVPVTVGINGNNPSDALWFEYLNRHSEDRDEALFEFAEKEEVVPSNTFWKWLSECVEAIVEYNRELMKLDSTQPFQDLDPELPPLYNELSYYEDAFLRFFGNNVVYHKDGTEEMVDLLYEATNRYPVDDEVWEALKGGVSRENDEAEGVEGTEEGESDA